MRDSAFGQESSKGTDEDAMHRFRKVAKDECERVKHRTKPCDSRAILGLTVQPLPGLRGVGEHIGGPWMYEACQLAGGCGPGRESIRCA